MLHWGSNIHYACPQAHRAVRAGIREHSAAVILMAPAVWQGRWVQLLHGLVAGCICDVCRWRQQKERHDLTSLRCTTDASNLQSHMRKHILVVQGGTRAECIASALKQTALIPTLLPNQPLPTPAQQTKQC